MSATPPPDDADGFLTRWSRRKRAVAAEGADPQALPAAEEGASAAPPEAGADIAAQAEPALTEAEKADAAQRELDELIARLPKIEEITAATDITGFMDSRIPDMLRNAALRAAWTADPAIRDFVNDAREYALDYNTPGAAPGYGLLSESERAQAAEFVKSLFSGTGPAQDDHTFGADNPRPDGEISDEESQPEIAASQQSLPPVEALQSVRLPERRAGRMETAENPPVLTAGPDALASEGAATPAGDQAASASGSSVFRRRGGSALPV